MCIMKNVAIVLKSGGKGKKNSLEERTGSQRVIKAGKRIKMETVLERIISDC